MHNSPKVGFWHRSSTIGLGLCLAASATPLAAQDDNGVAAESVETEGNTPPASTTPPPRRRVLDLMITVPKSESDQLLEQDCEEEADAGRIANEIVVCRQLGEGTDGSWNKEDYERRLAQRTQGEQPVDVAGEGIFRGPATVGGLCLIPPCPPEAALLIDVEALPEAPEGSDADRIARGLPPLGRDENLSPEEIQRRRRAAGLDAPDLPGQ
ncbi:hypothetical protein [uncultured Erythrobacter sp.]|uniref:hypothetical protein n=1 Tax=uncultured Erythrobacter sp. TaxID=263913 RepID=UPI002632E869|nr:hypothetical protein [uncultured Erythrobacter sp.]